MKEHSQPPAATREAEQERDRRYAGSNGHEPAARGRGRPPRRQAAVEPATKAAPEDVLLRRYRETGDPAVCAELVERFMPLARALAMRYRGGLETSEDLVQVASLGLMKALAGFDPHKGKRFAAYAAPTILGELRRHFRDHVARIHVPRTLQERAMDVDHAIEELSGDLGRSPTVRQVGEYLKLDDEEVIEVLQAREARRPISLDLPQDNDDRNSAPMIEKVATTELGYDAVEAQLAAAGCGLDEREQRVLRLRFEDGLNQYEIADRVGVSQMHVSRILRGALGRLLAAVQGEPDEVPAPRAKDPA